MPGEQSPFVSSYVIFQSNTVLSWRRIIATKRAAAFHRRQLMELQVTGPQNLQSNTLPVQL